jgi:hypothetical protein
VVLCDLVEVGEVRQVPGESDARLLEVGRH